MQDGGKPERLQCNRLAAGVRAADHERAQVAELEVDRDGRFLVEERMARPAQNDAGPGRDDGAAPAAREAAAGDGQVEARGCRDEARESPRLRTDERGEVPEDARHLVALGDLRLAQPVRVVDSRERLHEERLSRAGRVVDDAGYATACARPKCEHRPPTSLRDEVVLEVLGERWVASDLAQALGELAATLAEHTP